MADSSSRWGWGTHPSTLPPPSAAPSRHAQRVRILAVLAVMAAVALIIELAMRPGGSALAPAPPQAQGWTSVRSAYLTRCESEGASAGYCACVFAHITALPAYSTPAAFAGLDPAAPSPTPTATAVTQRAAVGCTSTPSVGTSGPATRSAI